MSAIGPKPGGTFGQLVGRALVITLAALLGFTVAPAVAVQTAPDNLPGFDPETDRRLATSRHHSPIRPRKRACEASRRRPTSNSPQRST